MNAATIRRIIKRLDKEPNRVITSGSGCHAQKYTDENGDHFHKVVGPGDTFSAAKMALHYLLFDLGVDVGMSTEELNEGNLI